MPVAFLSNYEQITSLAGCEGLTRSARGKCERAWFVAVQLLSRASIFRRAKLFHAGKKRAVREEQGRTNPAVSKQTEFSRYVNLDYFFL